MRRRIKRKKQNFKSAIFIAIIIALSSIGLGYGYWNEALDMDFTIETGDFDVQVDSVSSGSLSVGTSNGGKTVYISGQVISGSSETVSFTVKNVGTVPAILGNKGSLIEPGDIEVLTIDISPECTNEASLYSLEDAISLQSLVGEEETFDIDQILKELYPTHIYSFHESYDFKQGF